MTNVSLSRTETPISTEVSSFENFASRTGAGSTPSLRQMASLSAGWDEPARIFRVFILYGRALPMLVLVHDGYGYFYSFV